MDLTEGELKTLVAKVRNLTVPLKTDELLRQHEPGAKSGKRLRLKIPFDRTLRVSRRAIEVGIYAAWQASLERKGPISDDFEAVRKLAEDAEAALSKLIDNLGPRARDYRALETPLVAILNTRVGTSGRRLHRVAQLRGKRLWVGRNICRQIAASCSSRVAALKKVAENPGKPEDQAFALSLAEAWIYMFGEPPSNSRNVSRNPFLTFARLAWTEGFQMREAPVFAGAVQKLSFTERQIDRLSRAGPAWL